MAPLEGRLHWRPFKFESLPPELAASLANRDRWRERAAASSDGLEFLISDLRRWPPGATVRVAFLGGSKELHDKVARATEQITDACNLTLDFGYDEATGGYRCWSEDDTVHAAEIRVSFDQEGYWSLVGTDSNDPTIGGPFSTDGGRPGQRSLNLGGFADQLPNDWIGTTRHEFMHALAFQHEHQNTEGPCQEDFRWDDDPGYVPTFNPWGEYVADKQGRRPGIYTFLGGPPNGWPPWMVDHNLRASSVGVATAGDFDNESVMLYRFPALFYKSAGSGCAPATNGQELSAGDKAGLSLLYPDPGEQAEDIAVRAGAALEELSSGAESAGAEPSPYETRAAELLRAYLGEE